MSDKAPGQESTVSVSTSCYPELRMVLDGFVAKHMPQAALAALYRYGSGEDGESDCARELSGLMQSFFKTHGEARALSALVLYRSFECAKWRQPLD